MTTKKNQKKNAPALIAYHVPEREGAKWTRIGAAWEHEDGKGFSIQLELVPVATGKITLRTYEPKQDQEAGA